MTTNSELRAIVEELELINIGDAASYLGEETLEIGNTDLEQISIASLTLYLVCNSNNEVLHSRPRLVIWLSSERKKSAFRHGEMSP